VGRFQSLLDDSGQVISDRVQVHRVFQTAIWFVVLLVDGSATNAGNSWLATLLHVFLVLTQWRASR
jgi:hypothetical protein